MKALNELQRNAYEVVEAWLKPQMLDTKIIYMSDCSAPELKHLPIMGLVAMVQRLNKELNVNYKLGAEDTAEQDVRKVMVVEDGVEFEDTDYIAERHLESWDLGEESIIIIQTDEGREVVELHWADGRKEHVERYPLEVAAQEFEDVDRGDLAELIKEYQSREA